MNTKPQTTEQMERDNFYRQLLIDYLKSPGVAGKSFTPVEITKAIEQASSQKIWKGYVRRLVEDERGIDLELLNVGKPNGKVCWRA